MRSNSIKSTLSWPLLQFLPGVPVLASLRGGVLPESCKLTQILSSLAASAHNVQHNSRNLMNTDSVLQALAYNEAQCSKALALSIRNKADPFLHVLRISSYQRCDMSPAKQFTKICFAGNEKCNEILKLRS